MKKSSIFKICLLLALLTLASACSWRIEAVDQLIRAPKLSGEYASLQKAFDDFLKDQGGHSSILKPPLSGDYRSAYVLHDINGNKKNEALIFYAYRNNPNVVRVNILRYEKDGWVSFADFEGQGHNVHSVEFKDLNKDGIKEILISWEFSDSYNKYLSILTCKADDEKQIYTADFILETEQYTEKLILDIDFDKIPEIFIANIESPGKRAIAKLLYYDGENKVQIKPNGIIELDSRATSYMPLKYDLVKNKNQTECRIYIDTIVQRSPDTMVTEIVLWDNNRERLISPTLSLETHTVSNDTLRTAKLEESRDINGDKRIDIPTYSRLIDSEVFYSISATTEELHIVEWKNYTDDVFKTTTRYIDYNNASYKFLVPDDFFRFSVFINATENNRMEFFDIDDESQESGEPLFDIHTLDADQWLSVSLNNESGLEYIKTNKDKTLVYACEIYLKGRQKGVSPEFLDDLIMLNK